jgi:DUF4097 and DUF4098 domain-containing protein YvlB
MNRFAMAMLATLLAGAAARADTRIDERRPATKDAKVSIEAGSGDVRVIGWEKLEVQVTGSILEDRASLEFESANGRVDISVDAEHYDPRAAKADLEIHVPFGSQVSVDGFASEISVTGIAGSVEAEAVNGSIKVQATGGSIHATTVNGSVDVESKGGAVHAESVNGRVSVRGGADNLEASTVNGELVVAIGRSSNVDLQTVSGPLQFSGTVADAGSMSAESVSGSIDLDFGAGQNATVDITTFSGSIQGGPKGRRKGKRWHEGEKTTEITIGTGSAKVSVNTLSGSINVKGADMEVEPSTDQQ